MSVLDIAQQRNGKLRDGYSVNKAGASMEETRVEYGTAQGDSSGGFVSIMIDNSDESFEVSCDSPISRGDRVAYISTNGNGKAVSVSTLADMAEEVATIVRELPAGVLVAKVGQDYGALVNANGSFDVVNLTWSGDTPAIGDAVATFGDTVEIKVPDGNNGYGYFQVTANGRVTAKKYMSGAFTDAAFIYNNGKLEVYDFNGSDVFTASSWGATASGQNVVTSAYKYADSSYKDPAIYVSGNYTTQTNPDDIFPLEALPLFKIVIFNDTTPSIANSSGSRSNIALTGIPTGYKAIGIVGVDSNHGYAWTTRAYKLDIANQLITYTYINTGTTNQKCTFRFHLLCVPSANIG